VGGTVAWNYTIPTPMFMDTFMIDSMAAGPLGNVAVGYGYSTGVNLTTCGATVAVIDAAGASVGGPSVSTPAGACAARIGSLGFDPEDDLLDGYSYQSAGSQGTTTSGLVAGPVSLSYTYDTSLVSDPYTFSAGLLGRDTAGDTFAVVAVPAYTTGAGINFGGGVVSGNLLLEYSSTGTFVRSITPPAGSLAFGALGHIFSSTQVTGTVNYGCGTVGTAAVTSTVMTEYGQTGACLWSKALPASTSFSLDPSENVLLATTFAGTVDFGGGPLTSVGTSDLAIAKLDASGGFVWSKSFGASGASMSGITSLGATGTGGEALSVGISGAVDFGCGAVSSSAGATTLFANFDATGTVVYSRVVELLGGGVASAGPVVDGASGGSRSRCRCT
jgi:hypothetical protein